MDYYFIIKILLLCISIFVFSVSLLIFAFRKYVLTKKNKSRRQEDVTQVGIFHPYCNTGTGVERVMWSAVRAMQQKYNSKIHIKVYTGETNVSSEQILRNAEGMFNISVDKNNIDFVFLRKRYWVESHRYPHFIRLGQSLGSIVLGIEALLQYQPDVYLDTMGYAFTYPIFRYIGDCRVGCYTHCPIITTDKSKWDNQIYATKNPFLTWVQLIYYRSFVKIYGCVGRSAVTVMVISSWIEKHILDLWKIPSRTHRVYPPGDVSHLKNLGHIESDKIIIVSVSQFRLEKDHPLQLQAMYELREKLQNNEALWGKLKLVIIGSCRDKDEEKITKNLVDLTKQLSLEKSVEIKVNVSYQDLIQYYRIALIGLNTTRNEHFGICVVDMLAAGLITVAHRSGGPLMDIIEISEGSRTGYLAVSATEYADCITKILYNTRQGNETIRNRARASCDRFSTEEFQKNFLCAVTPLFDK